MSGTTITVPGAQGTTITESYPANSFNLIAAQQIATTLAAALTAGTLTVQDFTAPIPVPSGNIGELAVTTPGGAKLTVGAGYTYVAIDQSVSGPVTIAGGANLFAGNQDITYSAAPDAIDPFITVGNGTNTIAVPDGVTAAVLLGSGNNTVYADGTNDYVFTGMGGHALVFSNGAGNINGNTNVVIAQGIQDTIIAGQGTTEIGLGGQQALTFAGAGQTIVFASVGQATIVGGSGQLVFLGATGPVTIFGGSGGGTETLFGGGGGTLTYFDGNDTVAGASIVAGPEQADTNLGVTTMNAGGAHTGVQMAVGADDELIIGGQGNDIFYGGAGLATITGNGGLDAFIFGNTVGHTGGTVTITDWTASDNFVVVGYGDNAAQDAVDNGTIANGSLTVTLPDSTTIVFQNVTDPSQIHNQSFPLPSG